MTRISIRAKREALLKEMKRQGFTQSAFAEVIKISPKQLNNILSDRRGTSEQTAQRICQTLNKSFDDFFELVAVSKGEK